MSLPVIGFCNHKPEKYPEGEGHYACFSNWYPSPFELDGRRWAHVEQYFMYTKAMEFDDRETAEKVLQTDSAWVAKSLGKQVEGYQREVWHLVAKQKIKRGVKAKFEQNPELAENLLGTGDAILVEAAWYDKVWGVGLKREDPRINDPGQWLGLNWLGEILMEVRDEIRESQSRDMSSRNKILQTLGFDEELTRMKEGKCAGCGQEVKPERSSFKDDLSWKEFHQTGWCQECQDNFYG